MVESALRLLETWFAQPPLLVGLAILPVVLIGWRLAARRRLRALAIFTGGRMPALGGRGRRWLIPVGSLMVLALMAIGAARPRWGRTSEWALSPSRDLLIVLDVSRSMLAEDPPRSRLDRAKEYLAELTDRLQRRGGYRLGLIAFAGQARLLCPLTNDYDHFRFALAEAHPDRLGPGLRLGKGTVGTRIGNALELASAMLDPGAQEFQDVLLVSDGDDLVGDAKPGGFTAANASAIHVCAVGDPKEAARIPAGNSYLQFQGEWVKTRRHDDRLKKIAEQTGGAFVAEESAAQPLAAWFQEKIQPLPLRDRGDDPRSRPVQGYGWFFGAAIALLAIEILLGGAGPGR